MVSKAFKAKKENQRKVLRLPNCFKFAASVLREYVEVVTSTTAVLKSGGNLISNKKKHNLLCYQGIITLGIYGWVVGLPSVCVWVCASR